MTLKNILRKCTAGYKLGKSQEKDEPLVARRWHETFCQKWRRNGNTNTDSENIQSRYTNGIWHRKCPMLEMKSPKRHMTEGVQQPNQVIRTLRENDLQILGDIRSWCYQTTGNGEKMKYLRIVRKLFETKLYNRNLVKGINTWSVHLVRYLQPILKSTRKEPKQMDQRTRKLMTMRKVLYARNDVDRLYVSRREGGGLQALKTAWTHR